MLALHLYDSSLDWFRQLGMVGTTQPGVIWTGVSSYQEIEAELQRIGGLGGRIDELWFHAHGAPGIVIMPSYGALVGYVCLDAGNVGQLKTVCFVAMAARARVFFTGCNVGEGAQGDAFLLAAGPAMLGRFGGVMVAATSKTFSVPLVGEWLPPWGHARVAKVSAGGNVVLSTSGFTTILPSLPSMPSLPALPRLPSLPGLPRGPLM